MFEQNILFGVLFLIHATYETPTTYETLTINKDKNLEPFFKPSNFEDEILNLFGHKHKPHSTLYKLEKGPRNAAVTFMYNFYKTVTTRKNRPKTFKNERDNDIEYFLNNMIQWETGLDRQNYEDAVHENEFTSGHVTESRKANTAISFVTQNLTARVGMTDEDNTVYFNLETEYNAVYSTFSELRMFYNSHENKYGSLTVMIYQIKEEKKPTKIDEKTLETTTESGWIYFNITEAVEKWRLLSTNNHGLKVLVKNERDKDLKFEFCGIVGNSGNVKKRPFLVTYFGSVEDKELMHNIIDDENTDETHGSRQKRSINFFDRVIQNNNTKHKTGVSFCTLNKLRVNFKDLKWNDWIVAPDGYEAGYCAGRCSYPIQTGINTTNHALIQSLQHLVTGKYPLPCCVPNQMSPLVVFMLDTHGNPVVKQYTDMIVDSCGCF